MIKLPHITMHQCATPIGNTIVSRWFTRIFLPVEKLMVFRCFTSKRPTSPGKHTVDSLIGDTVYPPYLSKCFSRSVQIVKLFCLFIISFCWHFSPLSTDIITRKGCHGK